MEVRQSYFFFQKLVETKKEQKQDLLMDVDFSGGNQQDSEWKLAFLSVGWMCK